MLNLTVSSFQSLTLVHIVIDASHTAWFCRTDLLSPLPAAFKLED